MSVALTLLGRGVLMVAALWLVLVLLLGLFQRQVIYLPDRSTPGPPADVEVVRLTTEDGLVLTAWYLAPAADPASRVLVAPGNAGHRAARLPLARGLVQRGHGVLLLEYRGYGGNPGRPSEAGLVADARAARLHLLERDPQAPIAYFGESIGSAVVAALAAEAEPDALVLRSPFPELADVGRRAYPFLPVRTLLRDRHPTGEHLRHVTAPILVIAGGADRIVPAELSRQVATGASATYLELPGVDHNDAALLIAPELLDAVDDHVRRAGEP